MPFDQEFAVVAVIELSNASWLVAGTLPGVARRPLKKLDPDPAALAQLLSRWRIEAETCGRAIARVIVAYEAGRDGFWLARWLQARGFETHVIHPTSVAVSREHRRSKTDRLDSAMLMRVFLGWLRGERGHCSMVAIPTLDEEDAKRPSRERESLVGERTRIINSVKSGLLRLGVRGFNPALRRAAKRLETLVTPEGATLPPNTLDEIRRDLACLAVAREQIEAIKRDRLARLQKVPQSRSNAMVVLLARVVGVGVETADVLVQEILSRPLRDRRAVARYAGLTGSPDESGARRREGPCQVRQRPRAPRPDPVGLAVPDVPEGQRSGGMVSLPNRGGSDSRRKTLIVALARKLLIAFLRLVTTGTVPDGLVLRAA